MKKRNLICVTSVFLMTSAGLAQIQSAVVFDTRKIHRVNISHRLFMNSDVGLNIDPNNLDSVLKSLKTKGLYVDEKSEINVHQEEKVVDISCFNCIVVSVESGHMVESAHNSGRPEK